MGSPLPDSKAGGTFSLSTASAKPAPSISDRLRNLAKRLDTYPKWPQSAKTLREAAEALEAQPAAEDEGEWSETLTRGEVKRWIQSFPLNSLFSAENGSLKGALSLKEQLVHNIQASPAAERTALKEIQETIEARLSAISMPKGSSTEDTLRWVLSLFYAKERAGAKMTWRSRNKCLWLRGNKQ